MTNTEWTAISDPRPMLKAVEGRAEDRQFRSFAAASCRLAWGLLTDERSRAAVAGAERFVRGEAGDDELTAWRTAAREAHQDLCSARESDYDMDEDYRKRCDAAQATTDVVGPTGWVAAWNVSMLLDWLRPEMASLLRDSFSGVGREGQDAEPGAAADPGRS